MRRRNQLLSLLTTVTVLAATQANAEVISATKGVFTGTVEIQNKAPNTRVWVWQSSEQLGIDGFVNTAFSVVTDEDGNGTVEIPNTASGTLLVDHTVKTGTSSLANANQAPRLVVRPWYLSTAAVVPGNTPDMALSLYQRVDDSEGGLLQTWNPGMMLQLGLNPSEGQWLNNGVHLEIQGDVQAQVVNFTPNAVRIQVFGDPTPLSGDRITLRGLGLRTSLPMGRSVGIRLAYQGSSDTFLDGQYRGTTNYATPNEYEYLRLPVVGPRMIEGVLHLQAMAVSMYPVQGQLEIRNPSTHIPIEIMPLTLTSSGAFYAPTQVQPGVYEVAVKCSHWLRTTQMVNFSNIGATGVHITLRNGDCDGDNEVAISDYSLLSNAFLSVDGDANYDIRTDLNGSGEVDISDYSILSSNYGMLGDD